MEAMTCVCDARASLGEGTLWDPDRGVVWWLDIKADTIHTHEISSGRNRRQRLPHRVTALGLADSAQLIACGDAGIELFAVSAELHVTVAQVLAVPDEPAGNRFNDAKVDREGRFWAGTMDDSEASARGALYRIRGRECTRVRSGIGVPNGPCFLADGTMLAADTVAGLVTAHELDAEGRPIRERVFARFAPEQGYPDGMTVDAEDHVWIAFWDGACLRRLDPQGRVVREIPLPVSRPTCPAFGGDRLDRLYVTSASVGLGDSRLALEPWSGGLLRLDVGTRGRPPDRFTLR